jgi:hypothetical protein
VEVLANAREPEKAVLKSGLSYIFGGVLVFLGLVSSPTFSTSMPLMSSS